MKPRYADGEGQPPIHVASINRDMFGKGSFSFAGRGGENCQVAFTTKSEFLTLLHVLMAESVAFSVGGHCPGPAEEVAMLIAKGEVKGCYTEIAWSGPERWTVREIGKGIAPWELVADPSRIANTSFDPHTLSRAG
jgi:hypothetical protein